MFWSYLLMGDELGSATDIDRLDDFCSCHKSTPEYIVLVVILVWGQKLSLKNGNLEFSLTSRRDRVGSSNCLDLHTYTLRIVPGSVLPNFQVLICSDRRYTWYDFKNLYKLVGWPSSYVVLVSSSSTADKQHKQVPWSLKLYLVLINSYDDTSMYQQ